MGAEQQRRRVAGRRPTMPNGRAVVGGLLVAASAVGTFAVWSGAGDPPSTSFAVARRDLPVGTVVGPDDVELAPIDAPNRLTRRAFADVSLLVGQRTVAPLTAGELIQRSAVVVPEGQHPGRQISFSIDAADALAGTLEEGESVDVLATYGSSASDSSTVVIAAGAIVSALSEVDDIAGRITVLLTLPAGTDVLGVTNAVQQGTLTLVRSIDEPLAAGARFRPGG